MSMTELQAAITQLHAMDVLLEQAKKKESALTTDRRLVELRVMDLLRECNLTMASDGAAKVELKKETVYNVEPGGWPKIYERVAAYGDWELIQKRLSSTAVRERFTAGDRIAGVQPVEIEKLKLTLVRP